jgi:DNA-binding FadR family transcriptional regulator
MQSEPMPFIGSQPRASLAIERRGIYPSGGGKPQGARSLSYEKTDASFHHRMTIAARNPLLITTFDAILNVASDGRWRHARETARCINNQTAYAAAHRRIAAAVAERYPVAEEATRAHLARCSNTFIEHAFPRPEPPT